MLSLLSSGSGACEFPRRYTYLYIYIQYIYIYVTYTHIERERETETHLQLHPWRPFDHDPMNMLRLRLMVQKSCNHPSDMVNFPLFTGFFCIPGGIEFLPSTVSETLRILRILGFFSSSFSRKINHPWRPGHRSPPSHALTNCYIGGRQGQKHQKVPWLNRQPRHLIPMKNACHGFGSLEKMLRSYEFWWNELYIYLGIKWLMVSKNPCLVLYGVFDSLLASTDLWSQM